MNPTVTIYDGATGETITREMTDEEHAQYLKDQENAPAPLVAPNE